MFQNAYRLPFKLFGIPIQLDISFLLVLPVFAWLIGSNIDSYIKTFELDIAADALQKGSTPFLIGLVAAVGLFGSVLIHELGHSVVGIYFHLEIQSITLWLLGGMAQFKEMPRRGGVEAIVAIAGPVTSYALAAGCWAVLDVSPPTSAALRFILTYLMWMNVMLATFNLLPALPLDGGRVLRSLLALRTGYLKATLTAARVSRGVALGLGLLGLLSMNVFLILIAFFVFMAGAAESHLATAADLLRGIRVHDLMTSPVQTVRPQTSVAELFDRMVREGYLAYPVVDEDGRVRGLVTLRDIQSRGPLENQDRSLAVEGVMSTEFQAIGPDEEALEAFQQIGQSHSGRLLVLDSRGRLNGIISKTDLVRAVQVRMVGHVMDRTSAA